MKLSVSSLIAFRKKTPRLIAIQESLITAISMLSQNDSIDFAKEVLPLCELLEATLLDHNQMNRSIE